MIHCSDGALDYPRTVFTRASKATIQALLTGSPAARAEAAAIVTRVTLARMFPGSTATKASSHAYKLRKAGQTLQTLSPADKVWAETLPLRELLVLGREGSRSAYLRRKLYGYEEKHERGIPQIESEQRETDQLETEQREAC